MPAPPLPDDLLRCIFKPLIPGPHVGSAGVDPRLWIDNAMVRRLSLVNRDWKRMVDEQVAEVQERVRQLMAHMAMNCKMRLELAFHEGSTPEGDEFHWEGVLPFKRKLGMLGLWMMALNTAERKCLHRFVHSDALWQWVLAVYVMCVYQLMPMVAHPQHLRTARPKKPRLNNFFWISGDRLKSAFEEVRDQVLPWNSLSLGRHMDIATRDLHRCRPPEALDRHLCSSICPHTESPWSRAFYQLYELAVFVADLHGPAMTTYAPPDASQIKAWAGTAAIVE